MTRHLLFLLICAFMAGCVSTVKPPQANGERRFWQKNEAVLRDRIWERAAIAQPPSDEFPMPPGMVLERRSVTAPLAVVVPPLSSTKMSCEVTVMFNNHPVHTVGVVESNSILGPWREAANAPVPYLTGWVPAKVVRIYTNQFGTYPVWSYYFTNDLTFLLKWTTTNSPEFVRAFVR